MKDPRFTIGLAQIAPVLGDLPANLEKHAAYVEKARAEDVDLLVFPELSVTGYTLKDIAGDVALPVDSPPIQRLKELSRHLDLVAGFVELGEDGHVYNSAGYFSQGALHHLHRKVYLPTYTMFDEGRIFRRGGRVRSFDTRWGKVGLLICEDYWHPSMVYLYALAGATLLVSISCAPGRRPAPDRPSFLSQETWSLMNRFYAKLFNFAVAYCNRVGFEEGVLFAGCSEVVVPDGRRLTEDRGYEEALLVAPVDMGEVRRARLTNPVVADEDVRLTLDELARVISERGRG